ncbi:MAG: glyoxylate-induced protein [Ruminococcaceae bacterium]|nr:glyoxylate-induced protein [Oscillospiraceae bacterium]
MRLCVPVPCFFGGIPFTDALRRIKELGFDAAETYGWKNLDLDAVRNTCEETGVELISMCTSEFRMTDAAYRQAWLDGLKESCAAANRVGAKRLITQVGQDTGEDRRIQHENIVETLKLARPILEESGVTIMLEPLNTLVDHKGYYLWSAVEGFDIVKEVDCQFVKIVYDIYHQQVSEGNIIPNIVNNLDLIAHLHSAGHPGRHELQFGESDYKVIFSAVDKAGYTGCCGLEYGPLLPPEESLIKAKEIYG